MKFIDSHCHLPSLTHKEELETVVMEAKNSEVAELINIGTSLKCNKDALEVANQYPGVYATVSIFPNDHRGEDLDELMKKLEKQMETGNKIVAIGECGIDISQWQNARPLNEQIDLFKRLIRLALKYNLPLILHNRNADDIILNSLQEFKNQKLAGVVHCFSSSWEAAQRFLDLGFYISFSGFITRKSKEFLFETVQKVPQDRYILETDSPYVLPSPKYARIIAQKVAQVRQIDLADVASQTHSNTCRLFGLRSNYA